MTEPKAHFRFPCCHQPSSLPLMYLPLLQLWVQKAFAGAVTGRQTGAVDVAMNGR